MAKAILPTNFTDDVLNESMDGKRRYNMIPNADGSQSLEDVTAYDQLGSNFGASNINAMNQAINESFDKDKMISDMDELDAVTQSGYGVDALVVKEVSESLKEKCVIVSGTLGANGAFTYYDYPSGFTKDNCVCVSSEILLTDESLNSWSNKHLNDVVIQYLLGVNNISVINRKDYTTGYSFRLTLMKIA